MTEKLRRQTAKAPEFRINQRAKRVILQIPKYPSSACGITQCFPGPSPFPRLRLETGLLRALSSGCLTGRLAQGALKVVAYCTHPVLSGKAIENIEGSELDELVVTDTIPLNEEARQCSRIRQLSVANLLAETLRRMQNNESVSTLYMD